jgi:hypothetical protein
MLNSLFTIFDQCGWKGKCQTELCAVFEILTAVATKNNIFWAISIAHIEFQLDILLSLKAEQISVDFQWTTRRYISEFMNIPLLSSFTKIWLPVYCSFIWRSLFINRRKVTATTWLKVGISWQHLENFYIVLEGNMTSNLSAHIRSQIIDRYAST